MLGGEWTEHLGVRGYGITLRALTFQEVSTV